MCYNVNVTYWVWIIYIEHCSGFANLSSHKLNHYKQIRPGWLRLRYRGAARRSSSQATCRETPKATASSERRSVRVRGRFHTFLRAVFPWWFVRTVWKKSQPPRCISSHASMLFINADRLFRSPASAHRIFAAGRRNRPLG